MNGGNEYQRETLPDHWEHRVETLIKVIEAISRLSIQVLLILRVLGLV